MDFFGGLIDSTIGRIPVVGDTLGSIAHVGTDFVSGPTRILNQFLGNFGLGSKGNNSNNNNGSDPVNSSEYDITTIAMIGGGGLVALLLVKKFLF